MIAPHQYYPPRPKSRGIYILLAVCLGGFGAHDFYAERYGTAITLLIISIAIILTSWLILPLFLIPVMWIVHIVEACTVDRDGRGMPWAGSTIYDSASITPEQKLEVEAARRSQSRLARIVIGVALIPVGITALGAFYYLLRSPRASHAPALSGDSAREARGVVSTLSTRIAPGALVIVMNEAQPTVEATSPNFDDRLVKVLRANLCRDSAASRQLEEVGIRRLRYVNSQTKKTWESGLDEIRRSCMQ